MPINYYPTAAVMGTADAVLFHRFRLFFYYSIKSFTILRRLPKVNGKSSETYVIYLPANYERYNGNNNDENTANCLYISAR